MYEVDLFISLTRYGILYNHLYKYLKSVVLNFMPLFILYEPG
jgi:hypothetical protein